MLALDLSSLPQGLRLGTSSFSNDDWRGVFYPAGARPDRYLGLYASQLKTVEIDATFYAIPSERTVHGWAAKVPPGFLFSLKVPQEITHERGLEGCAELWNRFWEVTGLLGEKRGPLLFQFPYVARGRDAAEHRGGDGFRRRLAAFLPLLSREGRYVVEVRNGGWIAPPLLDLLREHGVALAWVDYYTMPRIGEILARCDPVTAGFGYIRFLGNHKQMDSLVSAARKEGRREREWDALLVDRAAETRAWIPPMRALLERVPLVFAYYNNHYAGFAPGSIDLLRRLWHEEPGS